MGKTAQAMALIITIRPPNCGPTLVVVPANVVSQWVQELQSKTTVGLKVLQYHGRRSTDVKFISEHDVVVTSYTVMTADSGLTPKRRKGVHVAEGVQRTVGPLHKIEWFRVILDECHTIKNRTGLSCQAAGSLKAKNRWCLSGTPIQNSIEDLYPYYSFLQYYPLGIWSEFKKLRGQMKKDKQTAMGHLHDSMVAITLRRTKGKLHVSFSHDISSAAYVTLISQCIRGCCNLINLIVCVQIYCNCLPRSYN